MSNLMVERSQLEEDPEEEGEPAVREDDYLTADGECDFEDTEMACEDAEEVQPEQSLVFADADDEEVEAPPTSQPDGVQEELDMALARAAYRNNFLQEWDAIVVSDGPCKPSGSEPSSYRDLARAAAARAAELEAAALDRAVEPAVPAPQAFGRMQSFPTFSSRMQGLCLLACLLRPYALDDQDGAGQGLNSSELIV